MDVIISDEDDAGTRPSQLPKRQKLFHRDLGSVVHTLRTSSHIPRHDKYTIAWICALHIELAAARAMLDDVHEALPTYPDDTNTYVLGSIKQHNVVITCLPEAQYGTNNAANVVTNMMRTFSSIRAGLMVGIGGGVPSKADVRLGDIIVGTRVMQYDLGKIVGNGQLHRTAIPRIPHLLLGTAVSTLRSKHELEPNQVQTILREKLAGHSKYGHPGSTDLLFRSTYDHESPAASCDACDHSKLVPRSRRKPDDVMIHYGAIASGNQVMKNGMTRDTVARQLDVICFEMEAAGLMDILPCLPIRGICDYSDSHKSKEWQRYAAATAAAYARELLEVLPVSGAYGRIPCVPNTPNGAEQDSSDNHCQRLLDSLKFEQIDSRKLNIQKAHGETCRWFLDHPGYKAWLDPKRLAEHRGFLWIRGKPGAGKSTIMKFAYLRTKRKARGGHAMTASFFFNARGEYLEKSISGMYRSLLFQLLDMFTDLQAVLEDPDLVPQGRKECLSLNVLKDLFRSAVFGLGQRSFTCFIDALDECDEQQIMDMVQYFEELAECSAKKSIPLRICFSSRHYPYIDIRLGIRITLEDQPGHAEDLANYVGNRLRITNLAQMEELKPQIIEKAAGVFLWAVLVVDILNKEHRRGRPALRKRLAEIPSGLSELFQDILRRDQENMEDLLLCILWILFAKRPLQPGEFYHALWSGLSLKGLADSEVPDIAALDADDEVGRYIISSSKGLAEITKTTQPTVQFIHESVRDFLVKDNGLHELWPDLEFDWERPSHERLKRCCSSYMNHSLVRDSMSKVVTEVTRDRQTEISKNFPFLEYAAKCVLYHADAAAVAVPQDQFLSRFPVPGWISINNLFEKFKVRKYTADASIFYILADKGFSELIRTRTKEDPRVHVFGERYAYPLFAALANGNKESVAALLNSSSSINNGADLFEGFDWRRESKEYKSLTPLSWAAQNGRESIVKLLLQALGTVNEVDRGGQTSLSRAAEYGHAAIAKLLLEKGADINICDKHGFTPFIRASQNGHEAVARLLIEKEADINICDKHGSTPLLWALRNGHEAVATLLIEKGADINICNQDRSTPLSWASWNGHEAMARLLIEKGADINICDKHGSTPLLWASQNGHEAVVRLLIEKEADINICDKHGSTPLSWASQNSHKAVARLLIEKGADINICDKHGSTPLSWASQNGHEAVARLLIEKGADINICNDYGYTLLSWASRNGYEAVARLLIERGADINICDHFGFTPLLWASRNGHEVVARLLIEKEADINICNDYGSTPLSWASRNSHEAVARLLVKTGADINICNQDGYTPLSWASQNGHEAVVRLLIEKGADMNICDQHGSTPLSWASRNGHEVVVRLLVEKGADINIGDQDGYTPLIWASWFGHKAMARLLIEKEADINICDQQGSTPLSWASQYSHEAVVRLLIEKGADINICDKHGYTPLSWPSQNGHKAVARLLIEKGADINICDQDRYTPLLRASRNGHEAVAMLLIEKGADINICDQDRYTPLLRASQNSREAVATLLIEKGADTDVCDQYGYTPLLWASRNGHEAVATLLIENGADINICDKYGYTPLLIALQNGHEAVARLLIEKGADINICDQDGYRPLSWASRNGHEAVARLLIEKGADMNMCDQDGSTPLIWASRNGHEAVATLLIENGANKLIKAGEVMEV